MIEPCSPWVEAEDVAERCGVESSSDTDAALTAAADAASSILFALSGRLFSGECGPVTVRPCLNKSTCYPASPDPPPRGCGCAPLSMVLLPGYPVASVSEVKVDGVVVDPAGYRLDESRKLVRMADTFGNSRWWPSCQRLDLADTEDFTFSVSYLHGVAPPQIGVDAAGQLACEIYRAGSTGGGECALPTGTTRVTRQGVTIERDNLTTFLQTGATGLVLVDSFLAAFGLYGARRRPAVWSPDGPKYAKQLG